MYTVLYPRKTQTETQFAEFNIHNLALNGCNSHARDVLGRSALDTQMENLDLNMDFRILNRVMIAAKLVTLGVPINMSYHIKYHRDWFEIAILEFGSVALDFFYQSGDFDIQPLLLRIKHNGLQPLTLQRLAANVIRRSLHPNALLGAQKLATPPGWWCCRDFITMESLRDHLSVKYCEDYGQLVPVS